MRKELLQGRIPEHLHIGLGRTEDRDRMEERQDRACVESMGKETDRSREDFGGAWKGCFSILG